MATDEPLEDRIWELPNEYRDWLEGTNLQWGFPPGVNSHNVHLVFNVSPFCHPSSANKRFENQVNKSPELTPRFFNRALFEADIATYPGDRYVVVAGPGTKYSGEDGWEREEVVPAVLGEGNPLWVVEWRFSEGRGGEWSTRGHFVVVADRIIAAPSVMDLLQSRWTSSLLSLSTFYRTASTLPLYSIEKGYAYLSPHLLSQRAKKSHTKSTTTSTHTSRAASPAGSTSSTLKDRGTSSANDDYAIGQSFSLAMAYGDEFMDENPLVGEPGNFKLSSTGRSVRDKEAREKEKRELDAARSEMARSEVGERASVAPSPAPGGASKTAGLRKEGSGVGMAKGKSPTSGGEGATGKKRRKSKAPITPGPGASPS